MKKFANITIYGIGKEGNLFTLDQPDRKVYLEKK